MRSRCSGCGTGRSVVDPYGGGSGPDQPISSPWGIAQRDDHDLFVAMAGMHQVYCLDPSANMLEINQYV